MQYSHGFGHACRADAHTHTCGRGRMLRIRFKRTRESHNACMCLPSDLARDGSKYLGIVFAGCRQWDLVHQSSGRVLRGHSGASATGGGGFGRLPWTPCGADLAPLGSKTTLEHPFSALRIQSAEKQEQRVRPRPHYAHLPHETFAALAAFPDLWEYVLGSPDDFSSFWAGSASVASAVGQEWLAGIKAVWAAQHPDSAWADAVHLLCPLGMHGDEAGGHGHSKILVMTWGSVAVDRPTLDSRILFTMLKDSDSAGRPTTDGIHNVLVWSLQALAAGVYPSTDENGRAFGPQHHPHRAALAGQSLASARCGVFAELRGDWEYLWKALSLRQYYGADSCCHLCGAHKKDLTLRYTDFRRASALRATRVSNAKWMASATSVLARIPGFHLWRCFSTSCTPWTWGFCN